jgi:hemerythrin
MILTAQEENYARPAVALGLLNDEHSEIYRSFAALDEAIARGRGFSSIMVAAEDLTQIMLLHFIHEVQFLEKISAAVLKEHRKAEMQVLNGIGRLDSGLRRCELSAALRLRSLCKEWIQGHMYSESDNCGIHLVENEREPGRLQA